jgi:hypothetical protein
MNASKRSRNPNVKTFKEDVKGAAKNRKAPNRVSASKLDNNFAAVTVVEPQDGSYRVSYESGGTVLLDITGLPEGATARQFNVCDNGNPRTYWMLTWDSAPQL